MSPAERDVRSALAFTTGDDPLWEMMLLGARWRWCAQEGCLRSGRLSARLSQAAPPFPGRALEVAVRMADGEEHALERTVPGWLFGDGPCPDGPDGGERQAA